MPVRHFKELIEFDPEDQVWVTYVPSLNQISTFGETRDQAVEMTRLPRVSGKDIVRALERGGFYVSHVRGSHHYLRRPQASGLVIVPVHGNCDLPNGTASRLENGYDTVAAAGGVRQANFGAGHLPGPGYTSQLPD